MNEREFVDLLQMLLDPCWIGPRELITEQYLMSVVQFADAGEETDDQGLVVRMETGEEFQIRVVKLA